MDVAPAIVGLANALVSIQHKQGGVYNDAGEWIPNAPIVQNAVPAVIQPVSGRDLKDMEEGKRKLAKFSLWLLVALALDDIVVYGGKNYRVLHLWERPEGGYTKAAIGLIT